MVNSTEVLAITGKYYIAIVVINFCKFCFFILETSDNNTLEKVGAIAPSYPPRVNQFCLNSLDRDNIEYWKILFNVVLMLLEQHCTGKILCSVIHEAPADNMKTSIQCQTTVRSYFFQNAIPWFWISHDFINT